MDISIYLAPLRKWWWLLVAATVVAAGSSYFVSSQQLPLFQSTTTILVGSAIDNPNPSSGEIQLGEQLALTYADIANREQVRNATRQALALTSMPQYRAEALPKTQILQISVIDTNPVRAQAVANELANQLLLQSPTSASPEEQEQFAFVKEQLDNIESQIRDTEAEIETLQSELGDLTSALQIQEAQNNIAALQSKLTTLQSIYGNLLSETAQGASNILTILEPANQPRSPMNQNTALTISLASAIGLSLACGAAYLLEYLDKSIKTPEEAAQIFEAHILGYIPQIPDQESERPYVAEHPSSPIAEAFRSLRINVEIATAENPAKSIFITSANPEAGKTSLAVNLAAMMAQGGHRVLLLDADLRRPNVHGYLGISNSEGLTNLFEGEVDILDSVRVWENKNLSVIPAGSPAKNPAELLSSSRMTEILETLSDTFDFVIIDGPPFFVADASVLASKVDAVLIVVQPGKTHRDSARSIIEQINKIGTTIIGVALNRIPSGALTYYGKYWQYAPQYSASYLVADAEAADKERKKRSRPTLPVRFGGSKKVRPDLINEIAGGARDSEEHMDELDAEAARGNGKHKTEIKPPKAQAVLRWTDSVGKRQKIVLREGDTILIGRDRINDVILLSRHVSRRHAVITWQKNMFEIADLGSTNGTFVNQESAERPIPLNDGDHIRLFDIELSFKLLKSASVHQKSSSD